MITSRHLRDQYKKYGGATEAAETVDDLNVISYKIYPREEEMPVASVLDRVELFLHLSPCVQATKLIKPVGFIVVPFILKSI
jgi:hypothetical protein